MIVMGLIGLLMPITMQLSTTLVLVLVIAITVGSCIYRGTTIS
jgi:hypothetical protein